jgi:hypothetical protein
MTQKVEAPQPTVVIEAEIGQAKAELLTEIHELKGILRQILIILKEGCENVRAEK